MSKEQEEINTTYDNVTNIYQKREDFKEAGHFIVPKSVILMMTVITIQLEAKLFQKWNKLYI